MSVRVVARIRPLLKAEIEKDVIVDAEGEGPNGKTSVKIPNPKSHAETYSYQFNSVYGRDATQADIFENEVAPCVKKLFNFYDTTIFAYGVTGTGKTHTMKGGKGMQDRGVIPRLLSSIYRRARKTEKDSEGNTTVQVVMSYYEIYNDKVFDLFEPPDARTPAGLPIRDNNGKTVVVGLTERPCTTLKDFERLYDEANVNRSTSATKLNAHSSRSHAILCVKIIQTTGKESRISTASAIDLAGSEDNRRTDNNKERLVESASINKSLFVLAQCVEAISKKQARIPYRESKMTRILSLGQNDGITIMILNLAPVRSYHLDTLSSLNFANRTKKIEVNEVENQPFFRDQPAKGKGEKTMASSAETTSLYRQPLRPKVLSQNGHLRDVVAPGVKPARQFSVYSDKARPSTQASTNQIRASGTSVRSPKRPSSEAFPPLGRPSKISRLTEPARLAKHSIAGLSKEAIEALIERKVSEALAERVDSTAVSQGDPISDEVQKRLEALEKRVEGQESERGEGLQYLLMAKQHHVRREEASALRMYQLALPYFPENEKLSRKVAKLQAKMAAKKSEQRSPILDGQRGVLREQSHPVERPTGRRKQPVGEDDESYHEVLHEAHSDGDEEDEFVYRPRTKIRRPQTTRLQPPSTQVTSHAATSSSDPILKPLPFEVTEDSEDELAPTPPTSYQQTPRTKYLLAVINSRDVGQIKLLKGVGAKRAEAIVNCLCELGDDWNGADIHSLCDLSRIRGVGGKMVENMRDGVIV